MTAVKDDSRETSPDPEERSAPAWISEELNRVYARLGNVTDKLEAHDAKLEELLTDSRAARPLLDRYLKMTGGVLPPWAKKKRG